MLFCNYGRPVVLMLGVSALFDTSGFVPRWTCGQWTPLHGWTHIISDIAIWGAYAAIPVVLAYFVLRRRDLPFPPVFWLFAAFIFACGATHLIDAIIFWWPIYRLSTLAKIVTAIASWATVVGIALVTPRALRLPGLAKANQELNREISERQRAEALLRESQEHLKLVLAATKVGTWDLNIATGRTHWSETLETIHGLPPGGFDGRYETFLSLVHPDDRAVVDRHITEALKSGGDFHLEYRVQAGNGERWLETKAHVLTDGKGKPTHVAGICMDVSSRKQGDARFRLAVEASPSGVVLVDQTGRIIMANSRILQMFGYAAEELVGQSIEVLVPQQSRGPHSQYRDQFARHPDTRPMGAGRELHGLHRDGSEMPVEIGLSPIQTPEGLLVLATVVDITSRKQAETERVHLLEAERAARNEAERANRLKDIFLANVSHELRTPLNAILGWSQLLSRTHLEGEAAQAVEIIERNARVQTRLIEDLLDMSRIISGKIRLDMQTVDLPLLVNSAIETVLPAAQAKNIAIQRKTDPQAGPVQGDASRLQQVVWNLLSNAIKFTPKGGSVEVALQRNGSHAEIVVADSGQGIRPEFLPLLFDRFRQADPTTTRTYSGLGLGLSIVKHLVELHGGTVRGDSEGESKGSTFTVALPLTPLLNSGESSTGTAENEWQTFVSPGGGGPQSLQGVRALVVDDDADACTLAQRILEDCGATVASTHSVGQALAQIESFKPNVIISDIGMPEQDGYQLIQKVRRLGHDTPAVALTAFTRPEDRARSLLTGYQAHVSKPLTAAELIAVVASLTGRIKGDGVPASAPGDEDAQDGMQPPAQTTATNGAPDPRPVPQSPHVLLVEDSPDVAEMLKLFLEQTGYTVQIAGSVRQAIAMHLEERFDVVISDLGLPDGSGLKLMPQLCEHRPIPGIALTGHEGKAFATVCRNAGFAEYLVKPAEEEALLAALDRVLRHKPAKMST
jgi:PAS domain S-box-containing protein